MSNDNIGSVSKNDKHNCLSGTVIVEGKKFFIDIYPRETNGSKWWSVRLKPTTSTPSIDDMEF